MTVRAEDKAQRGMGLFLKNLVIVLAGSLLLYLLLLSMSSTSILGDLRILREGEVRSTTEHTFYVSDHWLALAALFMTAMASAWLLYHRYRESASFRKFLDWAVRHRRSILYDTVLILGAVWVLTTPLYPRYDQRSIVDAAWDMRLGIPAEFLPGGYMDKYPFMNGIVLTLWLLSFLIGNGNTVALQLMNVLLLAFIYDNIGAIAHELWEKEGEHKVELMAYLSCFLFLPAFFYLTFIYGLFPSLLLSLLAVRFELRFIKKRGWKELLTACLCIGAAVTLKSNGLIWAIGMFLLLVYDFIWPDAGITDGAGNRSLRGQRVKGVVFAVGIFLSCLLMGRLADGCVERITGVPVSDGIPKIAWMAMGSQEGLLSPGGWNSYNQDIYEANGYDTERAAAAAKEALLDRIGGFAGDPAYALDFYGRKIAAQWNNPTFQCFEIIRKCEPAIPLSRISRSILSGRAAWYLMHYMNGYQTLLLAGTVFYLALNRRRIRTPELLPLGIVLGGFFFHIIWEAKSQYILPYYMLLLPYGVMGYHRLAVRLEELRGEYRGKRSAPWNWKKAGLRLGAAALLAALVVAVSGTGGFAKLIGLRQDTQLYRDEIGLWKDNGNTDWVLNRTEFYR